MSTKIPIAQLERLLFDDAPYGDLTTDLLGIAAQPGRMTFSARGPMVLALATEAAEILEMTGASVERLVEDGQALTPGQEFLRAEGQAGALLRGWKVAQNFRRDLVRRGDVGARNRRGRPRGRARHLLSPAPGKTRRASRISPSPRFAPAGPRCIGLAFPRPSWCFPNISPLSEAKHSTASRRA